MQQENRCKFAVGLSPPVKQTKTLVHTLVVVVVYGGR